jgi:hypothetical protein
MVTVPHTLVLHHTALTQALESVVRLALATYPDEAARIRRGHAIALQGGVRLCGSGLAEVQSQRQPATWYVVNGRCHCPDSERAPDGRCKHRWAKELLVRAQTYLAQTTRRRIPEAPNTPYEFPRWTRYEATYQGPHTAMQPVNGIAELLEPGQFFFQPADGGDGWECPYHEVALGPGIEAEAQGLFSPETHGSRGGGQPYKKTVCADPPVMQGVLGDMQALLRGCRAPS